MNTFLHVYTSWWFAVFRAFSLSFTWNLPWPHREIIGIMQSDFKFYQSAFFLSIFYSACFSFSFLLLNRLTWLAGRIKEGHKRNGENVRAISDESESMQMIFQLLGFYDFPVLRGRAQPVPKTISVSLSDWPGLVTFPQPGDMKMTFNSSQRGS